MRATALSAVLWALLSPALAAAAAQRELPALPPSLPVPATSLQNVASLPDSEIATLMDQLKRTDLAVPVALPYPEDTTFSLELELRLQHQLTERQLDAWLTGDRTLTARERQEWREERYLPPDKWESARARMLGLIRDAVPESWEIEQPTETGGFIELKTHGDNGLYHRNTPQDWAELEGALRRLQPLLPAGFYSAHVHIGRESLTQEGEYEAEVRKPRPLSPLAAAYQAQFRAAAGFGWAVPKEPSEVDFYDTDELFRPRDGGHGYWIGVANGYPTLENRIVTGLLRARKEGKELLDPGRLREQLWWAFALFDAAVREAPDLAPVEFGIPVAPGQKPTLRQIAGFADVVYGGDLLGKAIALKRIAAAGEAGSTLSRRLDDRKRIREEWEGRGLGVMYELHAARGGWEPEWRQRLLENDGARLRRLAADLKRETFLARALSFFPADFQVPLQEALEAATPPLWRRLLGRWGR